jgi:hypothetical protein
MAMLRVSAQAQHGTTCTGKIFQYRNKASQSGIYFIWYQIDDGWRTANARGSFLDAVANYMYTDNAGL